LRLLWNSKIRKSEFWEMKTATANQQTRPNCSKLCVLIDEAAIPDMAGKSDRMASLESDVILRRNYEESQANGV
jgi:hypothetical protein